MYMYIYVCKSLSFPFSFPFSFLFSFVFKCVIIIILIVSKVIEQVYFTRWLQKKKRDDSLWRVGDA